MKTNRNLVLFMSFESFTHPKIISPFFRVLILNKLWQFDKLVPQQSLGGCCEASRCYLKEVLTFEMFTNVNKWISTFKYLKKFNYYK